MTRSGGAGEMESRGTGRHRGVGEAIGNLFPGYFALVMATGIISIASFLLGMVAVARALLAVNVVAFVVLWLLTVIRLVRYPRRVWSDLADHQRGAGFFTVVAGTCVLGSQWAIVAGSYGTASALWWLGLGLWVLITYAFFAATTVRDGKPGLEAGINGAWLIAIVATQSVSILTTIVTFRSSSPRPELVFLALCLYLLGCILYIIVITLIFYRFTFFRLTVDGLTPPYWINMGAVAITTLAGSMLVLEAPRSFVLTELTPFLTGFTLAFWSAGTWWIPLLLILGAWRHLYKRFPLRYDPQYWGMVFPLGMYTACTFRLSQALNLPFLMHVPRYFIYVALLAWGLTFAGLVSRLIRIARGGSAPELARESA